MVKSTETGMVALRRAAESIGKLLGGTARFEHGGKSFRFDPGSMSAGGGLEVSGRLDDGEIALDFVVAETPESVLVEASVFRDLCEMPEGARLDLKKSVTAAGVVNVLCRMRLSDAPMGPAAETAFHSQLEGLRETAARVREKIPPAVAEPDPEGRWRKFGDTVSVVRPLVEIPDVKEIKDWLREISNCLLSGCNVALAAESVVVSDLMLDFLAGWGGKLDITLAEINAGQATPDQVTALAAKAPGCLTVPAVKLSMGANRYSLASESATMLASLRKSAYPAIFTGTMSELQAVFSGGQGGASDPLNPVPARAPESSVPFELLVRFGLRKRAASEGGISSKEENALCREIEDALEEFSDRDRRRLLPMAVSRTLRLSRLGLSTRATPLKEAVAGLSVTRMSFGGLAGPAATERSAAVQKKVLSRLTGPDLPARLQNRVVGQKEAVGEIVKRLKNDILLGRADKPLVLMAVGPSGVGKSFACKTLAKELGMPHVWFNAGQYGSIHTVDSILNGVPLGYVGSYKKGKKERCAGNPDGALLEVSDLDHASPAVRHYLADSFLEDIDTGRSQTASGVEFSTAGILFFFTVNLPYGLDEKLGRRTGFGRAPESGEIGLKAYEELKKLFSNAFLARVGQPVVFRPLDDVACAVIAERAVREAVENSVRNLGVAARDIVVPPGLGEKVLVDARLMKSSMGARALVKHARSRVAEAVLKLDPETCRAADLHLSFKSGGRIGIEPKRHLKKEESR